MRINFTTEAMFPARLKRLVSATVLFFFSVTFYSPAVFAAYTKVKESWNPPINSLAHVNPLGETLEQLKTEIDGLKLALSKTPADHARINSALEAVADLEGELKERDQTVRDQMALTEAHLEAQNLPEKVLQRQTALQDNYDAHASVIMEQVGVLKQWAREHQGIEGLAQAVDTLYPHLQFPSRNPQSSYSSDLDFVTPPPRDIYTSQSQINSLLGVSDDSSWSLTEYLVTDSATRGGSRVQELVAQLGNDPLSLYQWVYNNIRYIPSYGVMQGGEYTLQSGQGNAFDIASATIALYREAGIPARYRYGIAALPADAVQNWVGGVTNVDAATNLLSQGGIPQTKVSYGGAFEEIKLEHVWVEAYVNDQWVSLDPAFKQYTYTDGVDIENEVPFDAEGLLSQLQSSAIVNESEGWVQNLDTAKLESELNNYQSQIETYIQNQNPTATLGDVLGTQKIVPNQAQDLIDVVLPYERIVASAARPNLPENLYHRFKLQIGSTTGGSFGVPIQWSSVVAEMDKLTPDLVGKDLAISFRPATVADQQTLESYIPDNIQSADDLPSELPVNAINMVGEITLDNEVVAGTGEITLGQALMTRLGYVHPEHGWRNTENNLTAGQYQAIGLDMQGVNSYQATRIKSKLQRVATQLESGDFSKLTKHDTVGLVLQGGIQDYFSETYAIDMIGAKAAGIAYFRSPSYGTFSTNLSVSLSFGTPNRIIHSGVLIDIDKLKMNSESKSNCYEDWVSFYRRSGLSSSYMEHKIIENIYSRLSKEIDAVSTAKAIAMAIAQGQRIYTISRKNRDSLGEVDADDHAKLEMSKAIEKGYEVVVHQYPVRINSWVGSGYMITDPEVGVGAFKISGGFSGGSSTEDDGVFNLFDFLGYVEKVSDYLGGKLNKLVSTLLAPINNIVQALSVAENCGLNDAIAVIVGYTALGALFTGIAFAIGGFVGLLVLLVTTWLLSYMLSLDLGVCKARKGE